jgi:hypothetical protein
MRQAPRAGIEQETEFVGEKHVGRARFTLGLDALDQAFSCILHLDRDAGGAVERPQQRRDAMRLAIGIDGHLARCRGHDGREGDGERHGMERIASSE